MPLKQKANVGSEIVKENPKVENQKLMNTVSELAPVAVVEANEKIQQAYPNSPIAKKGNELIRAGELNEALILYAEDEKMAPILKDSVEKLAQEAGIDKTLIERGIVWKYFQKYLSEITRNRDASKNATAEFAAQELLRGKMQTDFAKETTDESKMA